MAKVSYLGSFPFCPNPIDDPTLVGVGTTYPLGLTLNELTHLYWKVKQISVHIEQTLSVSGSKLNGSPGGFTDPKDLAGSINETSYMDSSATIETDLVCNNSFSSNSYFYFSFSDCYYYSNLYYPHIIVNTTCHSSVLYDAQSVVDRANFYGQPRGWDSISYSDSGGSCSIDLFGTGSKTITMYLAGIYVDTRRFDDYFSLWGGLFALYIDSVGSFEGYSFQASATSNLVISESDTWPYNP
jgi:hypothetical protein